MTLGACAPGQNRCDHQLPADRSLRLNGRSSLPSQPRDAGPWRPFESRAKRACCSAASSTRSMRSMRFRQIDLHLAVAVGLKQQAHTRICPTRLTFWNVRHERPRAPASATSRYESNPCAFEQLQFGIHLNTEGSPVEDRCSCPSLSNHRRSVPSDASMHSRSWLLATQASRPVPVAA